MRPALVAFTDKPAVRIFSVDSTDPNNFFEFHSPDNLSRSLNIRFLKGQLRNYPNIDPAIMIVQAGYNCNTKS